MNKRDIGAEILSGINEVKAEWHLLKPKQLI